MLIPEVRQLACWSRPEPDKSINFERTTSSKKVEGKRGKRLQATSQSRISILQHNYETANLLAWKFSQVRRSCKVNTIESTTIQCQFLQRSRPAEDSSIDAQQLTGMHAVILLGSACHA
jgi:hypothetical protein